MEILSKMEPNACPVGIGWHEVDEIKIIIMGKRVPDDVFHYYAIPSLRNLTLV